MPAEKQWLVHYSSPTNFTHLRVVGTNQGKVKGWKCSTLGWLIRVNIMNHITNLKVRERYKNTDELSFVGQNYSKNSKVVWIQGENENKKKEK